MSEKEEDTVKVEVKRELYNEIMFFAPCDNFNDALEFTFSLAEEQAYGDSKEEKES